MRVSFVIPTLNQARFIRRCIDSCVAQAVPDHEIVVVDGLSSDGTQDVLRSYSGQIQWSSKPDGGQSEAVNTGIRRANGDVIAWVNSDDYYADAGVIRAVLGEFASSPRVDVVYGRTLVVDESGAIIRRHRTHPWRGLKEVLLTPTGPAMQPSVFFRRQLFLDVGCLREDLHFAMDYDLWLRLFPRAREVRFLDRRLACATFHRSAKSIEGMLAQIQELQQVKRAHRSEYQLGAIDELRLAVGVGRLYAYWAAVKLGLKRAA